MASLTAISSHCKAVLVSTLPGTLGALLAFECGLETGAAP
jgi:hypothetical protein